MVGRHIVNQRVDPRAVFLPKEVEGPSIAVLGPANQRFIVGQVLVVHSTSTLQIADQTPNEQRKKVKRAGGGMYRRIGVRPSEFGILKDCIGVSAFSRFRSFVQRTTPVSTRRF